MARQPNTDTNGYRFSTDIIDLVWQKANLDSANWFSGDRKVICGKSISRAQYGNRSSELGWEIDHIRPVSKGGTDHIDNLQPLHWRTNSSKSDTYPWNCSML